MNNTNKLAFLMLLLLGTIAGAMEKPLIPKKPQIELNTKVFLGEWINNTKQDLDIEDITSTFEDQYVRHAGTKIGRIPNVNSNLGGPNINTKYNKTNLGKEVTFEKAGEGYIAAYRFEDYEDNSRSIILRLVYNQPSKELMASLSLRDAGDKEIVKQHLNLTKYLQEARDKNKKITPEDTTLSLVIAGNIAQNARESKVEILPKVTSPVTPVTTAPVRAQPHQTWLNKILNKY
ncbi:hypothetical protein BH09DEP1_BH09DEP1_6670 [soil metagenome]